MNMLFGPYETPVRCIKFFDHFSNFTFSISKTLSRNSRVLERFFHIGDWHTDSPKRSQS